MKILPIFLKNDSATKPNFKGLHVMEPEIQHLLLTKLRKDDLTTLSEIIKDQNNNSVHILLDSTNGKQLDASLLCFYRLENFKTKYKQIPIFESKIHFIKRIAKIANNYKKQIENFELIPLKWSYSMLQEWVNKMYLK